MELCTKEFWCLSGLFVALIEFEPKYKLNDLIVIDSIIRNTSILELYNIQLAISIAIFYDFCLTSSLFYSDDRLRFWIKP